jgi:hypothetical protein
VISTGTYKALLVLFLIGFTLNGQVVEPLTKVRIDQKQEKQQSLPDSIRKLPFHIIAGAFRNPYNAVKKLNQLKALGYNARILGINQSGLTTVSYDSYKNIVDARFNLAKIKKNVDKDAWLLIEKIDSTEKNWDEVAAESENVTKDKVVEIKGLDQPTEDVNSQLVEAKILVKNADGLIDINGIVENRDKIHIVDYNFNLVVLKLDASGNYLKNAQSGEFSLKPNERKNLATLKIVIKDSDELKLYFFIRKDLKLIAKDTAIVLSNIKKLETKPIIEEDIEITGLVVEDLITKLGRDFYDFFYQEYSSRGSNYPFVINIIEKPLLGINSEITIDVDDRIVYKVMTRPNEEYLQATAHQAILAIDDYSEKRKFLYKKNIKF